MVKHGARGGTRTPNLLVRSQVLYPIELRGRVGRKMCLASYAVFLHLAKSLLFEDGVPGRSRTCDLLDRNQTLYPLSYEDTESRLILPNF